MVKRFLASGRTGFCFGVTREGEVGAGDVFELLAGDPNAVPVSEITRLYLAKTYADAEIAMVQRILEIKTVPESSPIPPFDRKLFPLGRGRFPRT